MSDQLPTFSTEGGQIVLNVVGGIIVAVLTALYTRLYPMFRNWRLQRVFGRDFRKDGFYTVIYGRYRLEARCNQDGISQRYPYVKTARQRQRDSRPTHLSIEDVASGAEIRGAAYLASLFGLARACPPKFTTDDEIDEKLDLSFVALGGPRSNFKSSDVLNNAANELVNLDQVFVSATNHRPIQIGDGQGDVGLILRIRPNQFPDRVWLVCAGYGEWGTSGAAWFLANKWGILMNKALPWWNPLGFGKGHDFAALVKVKEGQDESGILIKFYRTKQEVEAGSTIFQMPPTPQNGATTTSTSTLAPDLTAVADTPDNQQGSTGGYHGGSIDPSRVSSQGSQRASEI